MDKLKTNAFQSPPKALPGTPRKVLLLRNVAYRLIPRAQPGMWPEALVNCSVLCFFREKYTPIPIMPNRYRAITNKSKRGSELIEMKKNYKQVS